MARSVRTSMIILAVAGLVAAMSPVVATGATKAKAVSRVTALSRPPSIDPELRGTHVSPAFRPAAIESVIGDDGRVHVTDTTAYPASAIGQLELTFGPEDPDPGDFICTGWLIDSNTVLSSGHCAYEPTPSGDAIANSIEFFPGRNGGTDPFGSCDVVEAYSPAGWRVNNKFTADWSLMQLDCEIGDTVGWLGYFWKAGATALKGLKVRVEGYPGDKPSGTHWRMNGTISASDKNMAYYKIDTFGGQSGSPVFQVNRPSCSGPCGAAIHSYGVGLPGPGATRNAGPRINESKFLLISDLADDNDPA